MAYLAETTASRGDPTFSGRPAIAVDRRDTRTAHPWRRNVPRTSCASGLLIDSPAPARDSRRHHGTGARPAWVAPPSSCLARWAARLTPAILDPATTPPGYFTCLALLAYGAIDIHCGAQPLYQGFTAAHGPLTNRSPPSSRAATWDKRITAGITTRSSARVSPRAFD